MGFLPEAEFLHSDQHILPAHRVLLVRLQALGEQLEKRRAFGEVNPACGEGWSRVRSHARESVSKTRAFLRATAVPALTSGKRGEGVDQASHVLAHVLVGRVDQMEHALLRKMATVHGMTVLFHRVWDLLCSLTLKGLIIVWLRISLVMFIFLLSLAMEPFGVLLRRNRDSLPLTDLSP